MREPRLPAWASASLDSEKARVPFAKRRVNAVLPDSSMILRPRSVAAMERTSANFLQSSKNKRALISSLEEIQVSRRASSAAGAHSAVSCAPGKTYLPGFDGKFEPGIIFYPSFLVVEKDNVALWKNLTFPFKPGRNV